MSETCTYRVNLADTCPAPATHATVMDWRSPGVWNVYSAPVPGVRSGAPEFCLTHADAVATERMAQWQAQGHAAGGENTR